MGCPRKLSIQEVQNEVLPLVQQPQAAGQMHWTARKLHGYLRQELQQELGYSTLVRYLHENNYALRIPRQWPYENDEALRKAFVEQPGQWRQAPTIQLWFGDECGFEADPRPRRRWVKKGSKPKLPYSGQHIRQSVIGAVCPDNGQIVSLVVPYCDSDVFQIFLDTLAKEVPDQKDKRHILILDNASWHKTKRLYWHHFEACYLPPYSPDLNPIERLWQRLKADFFTDFITQSPALLIDRIIEGLRSFLSFPSSVQSICSLRSYF